MKIRLLIEMSGARGGQPWPKRGETLDIDDAEGAKLCASRIAEPVAEVAPPAEKAVAPEPEKRVEPAAPVEPQAKPPAKKATPAKAAAPKADKGDVDF